MHINYCTHLRLDSQMSAAVGAIRSELEVHDALTINFCHLCRNPKLAYKGQLWRHSDKKTTFFAKVVKNVKVTNVRLNSAVKFMSKLT